MRAVDLSGVVFESIGDPMTFVFCLDVTRPTSNDLELYARRRDPFTKERYAPPLPLVKNPESYKRQLVLGFWIPPRPRGSIVLGYQHFSGRSGRPRLAEALPISPLLLIP